MWKTISQVCTVLGAAEVLWIIWMVEYSQVNVILSDRQLKQLKTTVLNKTGITLRMNLKMLDRNDLPHEFLLRTRQKTRLRNEFNNNMSTNLKPS